VNILKPILSAGVAAGAILGIGSASAADMFVKAPYTAAAPSWSWTGLYIGGNAGYGIGLNQTTQTANAAAGFLASVPITEDTMAPQGFVGGGQIGYNWQVSPNWLVGVEGDFQGSSQKDSSCSLECGFIPLNASQNLQWFGTARARLGYVTGDYLWYVTGGGAWAKINSDDSISAFGGSDSASFSDTKGGFAVGAGVETHLAGNWTAKFEYLYMDLGTLTNSFATPNTLGAGSSFTVDSKIRDNIVRVGLNYKLAP
jgi:outer membrane immunogenic protein